MTAPGAGDFDAVVVGAGPGGLTCASILARRGLSVLVVDRNPCAGGTARSFSRNGFRFPCGPLGFGHPEILPVAAGRAAEREGFGRVAYRVRAFGLSTLISSPFPELAARLRAMFPADREGVADFFTDAGSVIDEMDASALLRIPDLGSLRGSSAGEYVSGRVRDERLRRLLGSMGASRPSSGFPLVACMWGMMSQSGIWYPTAGLDSLVERMARDVSPGRVELRVATEVTGILTESGAVAAVRLEDGTEIETSRAVSNSDFHSTFLRLLEPGGQPEEWRRGVEASRVSASILQVSLGLRERDVDLSAFGGATRIIYRRGEAPGETPSPDWDAPRVDPETLAGSQLELSLWSGDDPGLAPAGGAVLVIRVAADHAHFSRLRPATGERSPEYLRYKEGLADALVRECSRVLPGLEGAVDVIDVATPLTFEERGGRWKGTVAGWGQDFDTREDYAVRPLVRTPVEGLYMAGYQAFSWLYYGGVPTAVMSGAMAAAAVSNHDPPLTGPFVRRPFGTP